MPTKVIVSSRFRKYEEEVERGLGRALTQGGRLVVAGAQTASKRDYRIAAIIANVRITAPYRGRKGLEVSVIWPDFLAWIFEKGSYKRRRGKLSANTRRREDRWNGNEGVWPIRFMARGRRAADKALLDLIEKEIP